ncbi:MAG: bifunctional (p)ppGpp synthetase/guanosine-3',5'-bis(diphosphate) 3'-pyrophosphohydrolase, partial [Rickettsiales bacterium]|nr:bifunctional (p)ppGpp synthetase/guanosine-3',5'-bis(diphosphate) 3'-pyrophosphohydrolase [Rickettsiales bacterium]
DFAFAVHTDVGMTCVGARVNGRIVPLRTRLQNGDQVDIITSKSQQPSPGWEKFVVTGKARSEIRKFVRNREREEYVRLGKAILTKTFHHEGLELHEKALEKSLEHFKKKTVEELYVAVGEGTVQKNDVLALLHPEKTKTQSKRLSILNMLRRKSSSKRPDMEKISVPINGLIPGMAIHFAGCCHPLPGEKIVGIVNTGKGVTIHSFDCPELDRFVSQPERWIDVAWEKPEGEETYVGRLKAILAHQAGSLGVLSNTIAKEKGNINNLRIVNRSNDFFEILVDVEVRDISHLAAVMASLRGKKQIYSVERYLVGKN